MSLDNAYQLLKVFPELYVGLKAQSHGVNLGFATPKENNKAFEKRKHTVDNWSKPYNERVQDALTGEWKWVEGDKIQPIVVANDAVSGFRVADDVRRTYWGGGNVVWRIYDPRGYELEISSANLIRIIDSVGINAGGEIPAKCMWARLGANNILVPEGSDLWSKCIQDAATLQARSKTTSAYVAGDVIVLSSGAKVVYVGHLDVITKQITHQRSGETYGFRHHLREISAEYRLENVGAHDVVVEYNSDGSLGSARIYKKLKVIKTDGHHDGVCLIDHVNSPACYKSWASSTAKYASRSILAVSARAADCKLIYRRVEIARIRRDNHGYEVHPDADRAWTAPLQFYFKADEARVLNDSHIKLTGFKAGVSYSAAAPVPFNGAADITIISHVLGHHDDDSFKIFWVERPSMCFSGWGGDRGLSFNTVIECIEKHAHELLPGLIEVGTMIDGAWVPITK